MHMVSLNPSYNFARIVKVFMTLSYNEENMVQRDLIT